MLELSRGGCGSASPDEQGCGYANSTLQEVSLARTRPQFRVLGVGFICCLCIAPLALVPLALSHSSWTAPKRKHRVFVVDQQQQSGGVERIIIHIIIIIIINIIIIIISLTTSCLIMA